MKDAVLQAASKHEVCARFNPVDYDSDEWKPINMVALTQAILRRDDVMVIGMLAIATFEKNGIESDLNSFAAALVKNERRPD